MHGCNSSTYGRSELANKPTYPIGSCQIVTMTDSCKPVSQAPPRSIPHYAHGRSYGNTKVAVAVWCVGEVLILELVILAIY